MANWNTINELRQIFINKYINTQLQAELEKACSEEYELKRDYNGRQILELLQNVDDVYSESKDNQNSFASVKITYKNNILEVGNTGHPFSDDSIERLCLGRPSQKSLDNIGNKGTGLRSLLNDAEWIEIHSGKYHIRFSENYAKSIFDKFKNNPIISNQYLNWKKDYDLCFPTMNCPEEINPINTPFDTLIRVKLKEENNNKDTSIFNQLKLPFYKTLLFLPNINRIEVETDLDARVYEKISENNKVLLQESSNTIHEYYVNSKEIVVSKDKKANLIIAVPLDKDYDFSNEKLYCYFPIRNFNTPVHALIHAPFQTNNSRDDIPNDDKQINKILLSESLNFLKEVVEQIANKNISCVELPIITLTPTDNFNGKTWNSDSFNLEQFYKDLISEAKLLPTVNNELISIKDTPKYIDTEFPCEFKGKLFSNLLLKLNNNTYQFIKSLADNCDYSIVKLLYKYNLEELKTKINELAKNFNTQTLVKIFLWWCDFCKASYGSKSIPNLLKDTTGDWIDKNTKVYLPTDSGVSIMPESMNWVNLCILHQDFVNELISQIQDKYKSNWDKIKQGLNEKTANKRILDKYSDEYFPISFKEQSTSDLIIEEINKQIDSKEKSITFINWFFENYQDKFLGNSSLNKINFNFIDRNNNIVSSKNLFFGNEYNKFLSEKIFTNTSYSAIAPLGLIYQGSEENKDKFVEFLKKCGVLEYPKIYDRDITWSYYHTFKRHLQTQYNYQNNINYLVVKNIDNLDKILEKLTTKEIVQWFNEYVDLDNLIKSNEKNGYYANKSNSTRYYIYSNEYILYILNNTKWIEINNVKYSPNQIVKYSKLEDKISGYYGISENALISILGENIVSNYKLDFVDSMAQLPDNIIKKFLNELPNVDNTGEISKKLYEDIIKTKYPDDEPSFDTSDIKVFCFDEKFHLNSDVKYASRKVQKNTNIESKLIFIQPKRNSEIIKNWLGVEKYKTSLILNEYEKLDNNEFTQEINNLKLAFLASINETNNFISKLKQLKIIPCVHIEASDTETNTSIEMDNYNYIKDKGTYFIKIPSNCDKLQLQQSIDFGNNIIEIFKDFVTPQIDENLFGRLILTNHENRRRIIDEQFGFNRWSYAKELFSNQKEINEIILNFFMENELSENNLTLLKTIDFSKSLSDNNYNNLKVSLYEIGKDIRDLNKINSGINIDIKDNIKNEFDKYKDLKFENFEKSLYVLLKDKIDKQNEFLNICNQYKCFQIKNIENSININIENLYNKFLKNNFDNIKFTSQEDIDIKKIYNDNYKICIEGIATNEKDFEFFLEKNQNIKSILYFCVPDNIKQLFDEFDSEVNKKENPNTIQEEYQTKTINTTLEERNISKNINSKIKSEASQKQYDKQAENNERIGKTAEEIAYLELKKSFPNIKWHSKNSLFPADKNDAPVGVTCDMWNIDEYGKKTYFEIKSSINEFEMSIHEYNSMKNFQNDYEVVLVDVKNNTISRHRFKELEPLKQISKYSFVFKQIEN